VTVPKRKLVTFFPLRPNVDCWGPSFDQGSRRRPDAARRKIIHDAMVRLSDGDRNAFDVLVDELWPVILSFAHRGVGQDADAEDVAQEVFLRVCARITDFDRTRDGLAWTFGIASHEILTHRRRLQRRREVHDDSSFAAKADETASQEDLLMNQEIRLAFEQAVGTLTEEDQRALGLLTSSEKSGVAAATLRKRKQRALDQLRDLWRAIYDHS
jgi:RNA polymerase sigma-70 factor, ECF subfamily